MLEFTLIREDLLLVTVIRESVVNHRDVYWLYWKVFILSWFNYLQRNKEFKNSLFNVYDSL